MQYTSSYFHHLFTSRIPKEEIEFIFEIGSRDGLDALTLRDYYNAMVYAVECNPVALELMRQNLLNQPNIRLLEKAAWDSNTTIPFYPVVHTTMYGTDIGNNIGASSCFKARPDYIQGYTQSETHVDAVRLDDFCRSQHVDAIDLICMDVQGAALHVLKGLGDLLHTVKYLIVELERKEIYYDQDLFDEVTSYLAAFGLLMVEECFVDDWFSDYLFVRP